MPIPDDVARTAVTHLWAHYPQPYKINAGEAADWIMSGDANQQAALFFQMAAKVLEWEPHQSWPMQCRMIAECLSDEQCWAIRHWLTPFVEHLEAIPVERRAKEIADKICDGGAGMTPDFRIVERDRGLEKQ